MDFFLNSNQSFSGCVDFWIVTSGSAVWIFGQYDRFDVFLFFLRVHFSKDVVLLVKLCEFRRLTCGRYARRISSAMRTLTDCRSTCKRSFCSQTRFRGLFLQETPSGRTLRHREHSNLASRLVSHRGSNTGKSGRNAFYERFFQTANDFLVW